MEVADFRETITHKHSKQVRPAFSYALTYTFSFSPTVPVISVEYKNKTPSYNMHGREVNKMKTVNCFELYPSILGAKRVNELLLELFPYMHTSLNDDVLEMYITKEEYVFVLNELSKLNNYALTMPDSIEETNTTLTSMPIECAIVERYGVLYDLMFEAEYVSKEVDDETLVSDRDGGCSDFLIGKKFSASFDLDEEYQDYLNQKTLL